MSVFTKTFQFLSDAEGWALTTTTTSTNVYGACTREQRPRGSTAGSLYPDSPLNDFGTALWVICSPGYNDLFNDAPASENYWEWTGTWNDLASIPSGHIITKVNVDYLYRWIAPCTTRKTTVNALTFSSGDAATGPMELRKSDGTLVDSISTRIDCPARDGWGASPWMAYPASSTGMITPIEKPLSWGEATGTELNVPLEISDKDTTIKLRLRNLTPLCQYNTPNIPDPPPRNSEGVLMWFKTKFISKHDHIVVTITTEGGAPPEGTGTPTMTGTSKITGISSLTF